MDQETQLDANVLLPVATNSELRRAAVEAAKNGDMRTVVALTLISQLPEESHPERPAAGDGVL